MALLVATFTASIAINARSAPREPFMKLLVAGTGLMLILVRAALADSYDDAFRLGSDYQVCVAKAGTERERLDCIDRADDGLNALRRQNGTTQRQKGATNAPATTCVDVPDMGCVPTPPPGTCITIPLHSGAVITRCF